MSQDSRYTGTIDLPSRGALYDGRIPNGVVPARPLTTKDEKILVASSGKVSEIFDAYLGASLQLPTGMTARELLSGDRQYAMFMIRAASLGPHYHYEFRCDECRRKTAGWVKLDELPVKYLDETAMEPFKMVLPINEKTIEFRLFRGFDEAETERRMENRRAREGLKAHQLAKCIVGIDGELRDASNFAQTLAFVEDLIQIDSNELRLAIEEVEPGIETQIDVTCEFCLARDRVDIPMTMEFFRPSKHYRRRLTG